MSTRADSLRASARPHDDAQLVVRVLSGQRDVYAHLVRRHQQRAYRHARGMGLDYDTALDLVQDAFVRAYTRLDDCRDPARFGCWLLRIVRNLCLDHLKNVRTRTVPLSEVPQAAHAAGPADAAADAAGTRLTVNAALERLPGELREAFVLKHAADYTYDEVADITGVTPSAAKMRVHRARLALRAFLIDDEAGDESVSGDRLSDERSANSRGGAS
jgi:RNA polymerase sigma-70 factor, ECF subfamily